MNNPDTRHSEKHPVVYAFIDSQNLNLGVEADASVSGHRIYKGWKLDFRKFYLFLKDKYHVQKAFLFIGSMSENEGLYEYLQNTGYNVVLKPTTSFKNEAGETKVKGNVDTDVVLYAAAKEINNYDQAIVVSGDGDFLSLYEYLVEKGKLGKILIPNKRRYSQLLKGLDDYFDFVSINQPRLQKTRTKRHQPKHADRATQPDQLSSETT